MQNTIASCTIAALLTLGLAGCIYHPPIEQGNVMEAKTLQALHKGMRINQVISLLGDPVLTNVFKGNRLVYVYTFESDDKPFQEKRLIIYFENGQITRYTYDNLPPTAKTT